MTICLRCLSRSSQIRWVSTKRKIIPELNINIHKSIENEEMNPKKHPGVLRLLPPEVPESLLNGIKYITRDKPVKSLLKEGVAFERYLKGRHQPMEASEHEEHVRRIRKTAKKLHNINEEDDIEYDDEKKSYEVPVNKKIIELYKKYTYNWKPVNYDSYMSSVYLVTRTAPEYAVLCRVFLEIFARDKTFEPKSLFDFGSGVGTVIWAAKHFWNDSLKEFFCVDSSSVMNDISQALLQDGELKKIPEKGVYYRQFLPSQNSAYDIVVTAYTLFELPSKKARLETILNLWNKTKKYLVIVEHGSNAGFKLICEAREFILFSSGTQSGKLPKAHVLGPCPHDQQCPRLVEDETPCNFEVVYNVLPLDSKTRLKKERFSYVILKKGERDDVTSSQWPRIVRPTIKRSGHTICRLCTAEGKLEEVIFSRAKQGKILYHCARSSRWGDLIPVKLQEKEFVIDDKLDTSNIDMTEEEEKEEGELTEKNCNIDGDSKMR